MNEDNARDITVTEVRNEPNFDRQRIEYINDLLGKFRPGLAIKIARTVSKDKSELFEQKFAEAVSAFQALEPREVLSKVFHANLVFDPLFENPKFNFRETLSDLDAETFFKDILHNKQTDTKSLFFLLSTKGFVDKLRTETVRQVMKKLIEEKKPLPLQQLLSSELILNKIDGTFMQKFLAEARSQDPVIIRELLALDGFYNKFSAFLKSKNEDEVYKFFKDTNNGVINAVTKLLQEDSSFNEQATQAFVIKLPKTTINAELTSQNNAYFKLLYLLPNAAEIYRQNVADLKVKLAAASPNSVYTFLKSLSGDAVNFIFTDSPSEVDNKILQNFMLAFQDSKASHHAWFTTASNQIVEYLLKYTSFQSQFDNFLKALKKEDVEGEIGNIELFTKELILKGKITLLKVMITNELYKSMGKPENLITKAVECKQHEVLSVLAKSEYFSGRTFKKGTPQKSLFLAKFESTLNHARINKDFEALSILFRDFPEDYIPSNSYEKFIDFRCQVVNHPAFKAYKPAAPEEGTSLQNIAHFPDPCDKAPSFEDLAKGNDSREIDFTSLQSSLTDQINHYASLLVAPEGDEEVGESTPTSSNSDKISGGVPNESNSNHGTPPQVIYVPVDNVPYIEKTFNERLMESATYFLTALAEGWGIYKLYSIDPISSIALPSIQAYCQFHHNHQVNHGPEHIHSINYKEYRASHVTQVTHAINIMMALQAVKLILHTGDVILKLTSTFTSPKQEAADIVIVILSEAANALMLSGFLGAVTGASSIALTSAALSISAYGISHLVDKLTTNSPTPEEIIFQSNGSEKAAPTTTAPDPANVPENNPLHDDQHNHNAQDEL